MPRFRIILGDFNKKILEELGLPYVVNEKTNSIIFEIPDDRKEELKKLVIQRLQEEGSVDSEDLAVLVAESFFDYPV
ncbi:MAG: hypothetical protein Q6363_002000 [Candidatus Njordarchaeota archaeon]